MSLNSVSDEVETRSDLGLGYTNNKFYLPIAGCPSVSELEPQLTDKLTLKGNRAKLLHVPLWNHTYYTSLYLIDDITGELYACHQDELIAIKEQGYLQKEMAEEKYLDSQTGKRRTDPMKGINQQSKPKAAKKTPKILLTSKQDYENINLDKDLEKRLRSELSEQNRKTIDEATSMLQEQQREAHQQAVLQWNLKRRERKQLEKDLLRYQVSMVQGGCPTDQEIEQARAYITSEHKKVKERASLCQMVF